MYTISDTYFFPRCSVRIGGKAIKNEQRKIYSRVLSEPKRATGKQRKEIVGHKKRISKRIKACTFLLFFVRVCVKIRVTRLSYSLKMCSKFLLL